MGNNSISNPARGKAAPYWNVAIISFVILFFELLVIRLIATEIRIFAYLANFVLLASFIGSGLGMVIRKKVPLPSSIWGAFLTALILKFDYIVRLPRLEFRLFRGLTELLAPLSESYIWLQLNTFSRTGIVIGIGLTVILFFLIVATFFPMGQFLGKALNQCHRQPLRAYSLNILFSLLGIWAFNLLSFVGISPYVGIIVCQLILLMIVTKTQARIYSIMAILATILILLPTQAYQPYEHPVTFWSPYQKLTLSHIYGQEEYKADGWFLEVNNVGYMGFLDLSKKTTADRAQALADFFKANPEDLPFTNQYDLPYRLLPGSRDVLIIGGGGGNDAAAALRANIPQIEVVEIDPQIIALGKKYHPERPYDATSVKVITNDGRAYIETTKKQYNLIIMSLADSHTTSSSLTNLQLDNYLYTQEALTKAKSLLKENGALFLSFEVTRPWIGQRLQKTMTTAFGYEPKVFEVRSDGAFGWGGYVFLTGKQPETLSRLLDNNPSLKAFIQRYQRQFDPTTVNLLTDDWPYTYLDKPRLPSLHLIFAVIISLILLGVSRQNLPHRAFDWSFFFLGAGFMLFEFQNISKSSLIFGNTWVTNVFIITGILSFILAANLAVAKKLIGLRPAIVLLLGTLLLQALIPLNWLNSFSGITKGLLAIFSLNLPHFFSGIIFAQLFARHKEKSVAFGSNLIGSAVGGFFEVFSFLWGISSLLYLTLIFYSLGVAKYLRK
jgi:hypothetical protein